MCHFCFIYLNFFRIFKANGLEIYSLKIHLTNTLRKKCVTLLKKSFNSQGLSFSIFFSSSLTFSFVDSIETQNRSKYLHPTWEFSTYYLHLHSINQFKIQNNSSRPWMIKTDFFRLKSKTIFMILRKTVESKVKVFRYVLKKQTKVSEILF